LRAVASLRKIILKFVIRFIAVSLLAEKNQAYQASSESLKIYINFLRNEANFDNL
jgi:hypothetical protein